MDPLLHYGLRAFLVLVLGASLLHHLRDLPRFRQTLAGYDLVPSRLVPLVSVAVLLVFAVVMAALLAGDLVLGRGAFGGGAMAGGASALVFAGFGAALAVNLLRGNTAIDCGCSWVRSDRLSPLLLVRSAVLVCVSLAVIVEPGDRPLLWVDGVNIVFFAGAGLALMMIGDLLVHLKMYRESYL